MRLSYAPSDTRIREALGEDNRFNGLDDSHRAVAELVFDGFYERLMSDLLSSRDWQAATVAAIWRQQATFLKYLTTNATGKFGGTLITKPAFDALATLLETLAEQPWDDCPFDAIPMRPALTRQVLDLWRRGQRLSMSALWLAQPTLVYPQIGGAIL